MSDEALDFILMMFGLVGLGAAFSGAVAMWGWAPAIIGLGSVMFVVSFKILNE